MLLMDVSQILKSRIRSILITTIQSVKSFTSHTHSASSRSIVFTTQPLHWVAAVAFWISWRPHTTGLLMHNLPWPAHRNLLKPLTDSVHIRRTISQRYLSFILIIEKLKKKPLRTLVNVTKYDVRNLRYIMLNAGKNKHQ